MILPYRQTNGLARFRAFWELQLSLHPTRRYIPESVKPCPMYTHRILMRKIGNQMAKKADKKKPKFVWQGYVTIHIPESKTSELEKFVTDDKSVYALYNAMLTTDYKFSQYFDPYVDGIKTTITCHNSDSSNFGYALSAWADNWYDSLAIVIYKHEILSERDWDSASSKSLRKFG